jgi:prepilin peptidase CpaA
MLADFPSILHAAALGAGAVLLVAAGLHDVAARTVPNRLAVMVAGLGVVARLLDANLLIGLAVAFAVFSVAFFCWRRGWMGGGDVKLLGAVALLVPPTSVGTMVVDVALAGGVLAVTYLVLQAALPSRIGSPNRPKSFAARALRAERWRISRKGPIPYASAIAVGALFCLWGE